MALPSMSSLAARAPRWVVVLNSGPGGRCAGHGLCSFGPCIRSPLKLPQAHGRTMVGKQIITEAESQGFGQSSIMHWHPSLSPPFVCLHACRGPQAGGAQQVVSGEELVKLRRQRRLQVGRGEVAHAGQSLPCLRAFLSSKPHAQAVPPQ